VITPCGGGGGSGIQFTTYPQDGSWLYVETTELSPASPNGWGIEFRSADGVKFSVTTLFQVSASQVALQSDGLMDLSIGGNLTVSSDGSTTFNSLGDIDATATGDASLTGTDVALNASGDVELRTDNSVVVTLGIGGALLIQDHNFAPLLRVTEAGTYHIKTGAAWVADL
jgi:hypothetical protein